MEKRSHKRKPGGRGHGHNTTLITHTVCDSERKANADAGGYQSPLGGGIRFFGGRRQTDAHRAFAIDYGADEA